MPRSELGTKRVCPTTGRRFYDLGRDPVISPYTGDVVPITAASAAPRTLAPAAARKAPAPEEVEDDEGAELVSLSDVEAAESADDKDPALESDDVLETDDAETPDADTLIEDDEEADTADLIDVEKEDDE